MVQRYPSESVSAQFKMQRSPIFAIARKEKTYIKRYDDSEKDLKDFQIESAYYKFSTSYGLVVKTADARVVVIERRYPYCVQNFLIQRHKKKDIDSFQFDEDLKQCFEKEHLPKLKVTDRHDYLRFLLKRDIEDKYDFPHGQMNNKTKKRILEYPREKRKWMFYTAYKEFLEETGYVFTFDPNDVSTFPLYELHFVALNGVAYTQYYFVIENAQNLRKICLFGLDSGLEKKIKEEREFYHTRIVKIKTAADRFQKQQNLKIDFKYLLLSSFSE